MATNGNVNFQEGHVDQSASQQQSNTSSSNIGKDEVGWYFVEQFYNTLSRSPEKLHLFYGKRSQFVYGVEAEVTNVSVGRQTIQERIKNLEFQDCKVRVTNVDSQSSGENIVIQVIGELSNKSLEPKKFVQTFVLAQQPSGYFVLNDIMRYIDEGLDEDEVAVPEAKEAPAANEPETAVVPEGHLEPESSPKANAEEPVKEAEAAPLDAAAVDQKLEDVTSAATETAPATTEKSAEPAVEVELTVVKTKEDAQPEAVNAEKAIKEAEKEEAKEGAPKEPSPTPAAPRAAPAEKPAPAEPEKPKEAPKPMTWASRIAAAAAPVAKAVIPSLPKIATPPTQSQAPKPAPAAAQKAPAPAAQNAEAAAPASKDQNDEWQSVGADSKRQNRPVSISGPQETGREGAMAYIKYVTDKVQTEDLRAELAQYGELAYFDVNRQKNCAFVEFKTTAGYNAAVAANPHTVNGENIIVEQRRPKANAYGGSNYSGNRGGAANRGRGGFEGQQRQNSTQGAPRTGGFQGQNRGGRGGAARGGARAGSQAAA
ncbi:hypothetical protein CONLIGDRAFT_695675 [Coniochaeta ligniaria NRRL 30616]|uniref:NTF2-domain-containing protein n=1 Tax=Coniochaeta ligniaria NRRL 30616 TaxID=1408157 RepID=A0A1J7IZN5_9PEZI|nr:hypothetical protein CONLIGDRAFT_695675 [Coniochaeta ligniaria NRRL 30616]